MRLLHDMCSLQDLIAKRRSTKSVNKERQSRYPLNGLKRYWPSLSLNVIVALTKHQVTLCVNSTW